MILALIFIFLPPAEDPYPGAVRAIFLSLLVLKL